LVTASEKDESVQLIGFYAGDRLFGVNILTVREILRDPSIEPIDDAPPFLIGCVRIRGEIIPLINLRQRLSNSLPVDTQGPVWVLIATVDDRVLAFVVDSVTRILRIQMDSILPAPDLILTGLRSQYIQGVCNSELGMLIVIDLARMLGADENKALRKTTLPQLT
jgi:purine-binding chemotaxis protein CheW